MKAFRVPLFVALLIGYLLVPLGSVSQSARAPADASGVPGEDEFVCSSPLCHTTFDLNSGPGQLSTTLPSTYAPGETIDFMVSVEQADRTRFGFQVTAKDANLDDVGTFNLVDANTAFSIGSDNHDVTHNFASSVSTWTVQWTAPNEEVGDIVFYTAAVAADASGSNDNDYVYTITPTLGGTSTSTEGADLPASFALDAVFPNPFAEQAQLSYTLDAAADVTLALYDMQGQQVRSEALGLQPAGPHQYDLSGAGLSTGAYLVVLKTPEQSVSRVVQVVR